MLDFRSTESRATCTQCRGVAVDVLEPPVTPGKRPSSIAGYDGNRSPHCVQLGMAVCAHCHVQLALRDGEPAPACEPLQVSWFTTDEHQPRTAEIPLQRRQVFGMLVHRERVSERKEIVTLS